MFPVLFSLGPLTFQTINLFILLGMVGGAFLFWRRTHEEHYEDDEVFDALILSFLGGVVLGRVSYILFHFSDFGFDFFSWIAITVRPGINEVFAILGMCVALASQAKKRKWNHFEMLDYLPLSMTFFMILLWVGRFFAGSFLGSSTSLPLGVSFPTVFDLRHPVQIYYAISFVLLLVIMSFFEKRYRFFPWYRGNKQTAESGFIFGIFLIGFGFIRFGWGFLHIADMNISDVSIDKIVYLTVILSGMLVILLQSGRFHRRKKLRKLNLGKEGKRSRGIFWKRLFRVKKPVLEE